MGVPDGANAEERPEDGTPAEPVDPGSPADQVENEIVTAEVATTVTDWWGSLFGTEGKPWEAGGGGAGGKFMFANIEELDAVIKKWEAECDAIREDGKKIREAWNAIAEPAGDGMSADAAAASRKSLLSMFSHNTAMMAYAQDYIRKLYESRNQMQTSEDGAVAQMRSVQI